MKISASFLQDISKLKEIDSSNIDYLHCDIMDGKFVPNKTVFFEEIEKVRKELKKPLDVHLMVKDIYSYINVYSSLKPTFITFHLEIGDTLNIIDFIKEKGIKVGISIKPETNIEQLVPYLEKLDLVLIMSVEPGYGGQEFIEIITNKITFLNKYREKNNLSYLIEVDGGINEKSINLVKEADIIVVGSYLTKAQIIEEKVQHLKTLM